MKMTWLHDSVNEILRRRGKEIIESHKLYEWQRDIASIPSYKRVELPEEAIRYLRPDNPRLLDLQRRYSTFNLNATAPLVWHEGYLRDEEIPYFRGDNAYVWQVRGQNTNILGYTLAFYYLKSVDRLNFLEKMSEDGAFGNFTFHIGNRDVSRDLLDSVAEMYFLERHLNISNSRNLTILDIGAGYGRLALRATQGWPTLQNVLCTDAVASSTFISEFYLRYRGVGDKAEVIPLDEIERTLTSRRIDLAVNIHSFSECQLAAIDWWVGLIARGGVKHLMIVPNSTDPGGERLLTNDRKDFTPLLEKHGYRLIAAEPKFHDVIVQEYAIEPSTHFLFALS
jgi:hypothetical protein